MRLCLLLLNACFVPTTDDFFCEEKNHQLLYRGNRYDVHYQPVTSAHTKLSRTWNGMKQPPARLRVHAHARGFGKLDTSAVDYRLADDAQGPRQGRSARGAWKPAGYEGAGGIRSNAGVQQVCTRGYSGRGTWIWGKTLVLVLEVDGCHADQNAAVVCHRSKRRRL